MSEQNSTNPLTVTGGTDITTGNSSGGFMSNLNLEGHPAIRGLSQLTMARQVAIMLGLALSVAIGIAVVLWSQDANYARLYTELNDKDTAEILEALNAQGVKYKIEEGGGIMVLADKVNDTKLKLAAQGLPKSNSLGYELLDKEQSFGTSKTAELARHQRALEGEIARTIMSIQSVKNARVLLALPVQSVFVRERKKPSASVIVHLYQGRTLDKGQVEAIVHLVSSSVPQLDADHVTVVDYKGQMLNSRASAAENLTASQFEYKTGIEEHLMHRIENIMSPLVGPESMRVQISADVDFTETDKTQEMFNPDLPALRSEQTTDEENKENPRGVPGALSNQPTPAGQSIEVIPPAQPNSIAATESKGYASKTATRNYELDKTITHTKLASGLLRRLSVAVVVDDRHIIQANGDSKSQPYAQEDLNRFNDLVEQAVGFDSGRGDQVTVTNVSFRGADLDAPPELPLWKETWFIELAKQVAAVLAILFLIFGVLRPTIRALIAKDEDEKRAIAEAEEQARAAALLAAGFILDENGTPLSLTDDDMNKIDDLLESMDMPHAYQSRLDYLKRLADDDPKVIAQVLKTWVRKMSDKDSKVLMKYSDRAAVLLLALGMDKAAFVLKQMNPREVQAICSAMANVGDVSVPLIEEIIEDFIKDVKSQTALGMNSDDYIRTVLVNALGADKANSILDRIFQGGSSKGIEQLKWLDSRSISDMIRAEHPQIIATLLSLMDPEQAAEVMMYFPEAIRPDLMMRVATMQGIQPQALRELDQIMEKQLTGSDNVKSTSLGGVDTAASILNFMETSATELVMNEITEQRAELAQEIQEKMFTFDDLIDIDNRGMQTLLREVATGNLLLALRGVDEALKEKIFSNMSKRAAEMLRDDLEASPPAKLSDVEQAQKDILAIAKRLAESGEINLGGSSDDFV